MSYVYGPVPSRRLGRSLGVDLVPYKSCTYDCIYCQLGRTTNKTTERKEWAPVSDIVSELEGKLETRPDYITLSGSGEPTLHSRIGDIIEKIRQMTSIPVAVLTNGSLLWDGEVRRELASAHLVVPSLDAGDAAMFEAVNRPHPEISFENMLDGLISFRKEYSGQYWLEVFLLTGHTALGLEATKLAECAGRINPDRVQLNTATRPAAEDWAAAVPSERLKDFTEIFSPKAEVIADFRDIHQEPLFRAGQEEIIHMLRRRPCTPNDIANGLPMHLNDVLKYLDELSAQGVLEQSRVAGKTYYSLRANQEPG